MDYNRQLINSTLRAASKDCARVPLTLLSTMDLLGEPVTPVQLADYLDMSVSAVAMQLTRATYLGYITRSEVRYYKGVLRPFYTRTREGEEYLRRETAKILAHAGQDDRRIAND